MIPSQLPVGKLLPAIHAQVRIAMKQVGIGKRWEGPGRMGMPSRAFDGDNAVDHQLGTSPGGVRIASRHHEFMFACGPRDHAAGVETSRVFPRDPANGLTSDV